MGGAVAPIVKPIAKVVGLAPSAPAQAAAPAAAPAAPMAEAAAVGQARAEREITGALASRRKRGRASTVLGSADETAAAQTATKTLLGQ